MAHFYGKVQGDRGEAARSGNKISGLTTVARTLNGEIIVRLEHAKSGDWADVVLHDGSGNTTTLYSGPLSQYEDHSEEDWFKTLRPKDSPA